MSVPASFMKYAQIFQSYSFLLSGGKRKRLWLTILLAKCYLLITRLSWGRTKTLQLIDNILSDDRVPVHSDWACSTLPTHLSPRLLLPCVKRSWWSHELFTKYYVNDKNLCCPFFHGECSHTLLGICQSEKSDVEVFLVYLMQLIHMLYEEINEPVIYVSNEFILVYKSNLIWLVKRIKSWDACKVKRARVTPSHLAANHRGVQWRSQSDETNRTTSSGKSRDASETPLSWIPSMKITNRLARGLGHR